MFAAKLLSVVVLAASVLAAPKGRLADRVARRAERSHLTRPVQLIEQPDIVELTNVSHPEYSSNWAGAVLSTSAVSPFIDYGARPYAHSVYRHIGHLEVRYGHVHRADAEGALGRLWRLLRVCVGRHRRRHLRHRHPPDWS